MTIDQHLLNERTIAAAEFLAEYLPRHVSELLVSERDGHCEIALGCPYDDDRQIKISTLGSEITLEFGQCHTHFGDSDGTASEADLVGQMIVKIVALSGGFEASYSAWSGEHCLGGGWLPTGVDGSGPFAHFPRADRLMVVAWEPREDRDIRRPAASDA